MVLSEGLGRGGLERKECNFATFETFAPRTHLKTENVTLKIQRSNSSFLFFFFSHRMPRSNWLCNLQQKTSLTRNWHLAVLFLAPQCLQNGDVVSARHKHKDKCNLERDGGQL